MAEDQFKLRAAKRRPARAPEFLADSRNPQHPCAPLRDFRKRNQSEELPQGISLAQEAILLYGLN